MLLPGGLYWWLIYIDYFWEERGQYKDTSVAIILKVGN